MGMVAWGDASINTAKNAGQIKQVASVDFDTTNVLAIADGRTRHPGQQDHQDHQDQSEISRAMDRSTMV